MKKITEDEAKEKLFLNEKIKKDSKFYVEKSGYETDNHKLPKNNIDEIYKLNNDNYHNNKNLQIDENFLINKNKTSLQIIPFIRNSNSNSNLILRENKFKFKYDENIKLLKKIQKEMDDVTTIVQIELLKKSIEDIENKKINYEKNKNNYMEIDIDVDTEREKDEEFIKEINKIKMDKIRKKDLTNIFEMSILYFFIIIFLFLYFLIMLFFI